MSHLTRQGQTPRPARTRRPAVRLEALEAREVPAINVAVVGFGVMPDDAGFLGIVTQLNNDTYFDFNAVPVLAPQVDTAAELNAYDVVILGHTGGPTPGDPTDNPTFTAALRAWVEAGGGVVMTGPGILGAGSMTGAPIADIDAIIPVVTSGAGTPNPAGTVTIGATAHPVTAGVDSFTLSAGDFIETPAGGADAGTTVLGTTAGAPSVVVGTAGSGRGVYLGPLYSGTTGAINNAELRIGEPDQLLEQAVNWAAGATGGGGGNSTPTDITLQGGNLPENQPAGSAVGQLSATDPNAGDSHTFTLVAGPGGADNGSFSITGNFLRANAPFNFEFQSSYSVRVRATDQGGLSHEKAFAVSVSNVNETPTNLVLSASSFPENQPVGTTVGTFSAEDPDAGNTHTFALVSGTGGSGNASFTIVGNTLQTAAAFDFEAQASYSIRVRATDQGGLSHEKAFVVSVTNVNEGPTNLVLSASSLPENQPVGTTVGTFSAEDPDAGNTHTYSLVAGTGDTDNASFTVSGNTLRTAAAFDFETQASYTVRVRAMDQGGLSVDKVFTITVVNQDEGGGGGGNTLPTLSGVPVSFNVNEGQAVTFDADATDPDAGQTITFGLAGAPVGANIDPGTGAFSWTPTEVQGPDTFVFNVTANDGTATAERTVYVVVREVNTAPALADVTVSDPLVRGATLTFTATAEDPDLVVGLPNAQTFSLVGAPVGAFIDPDTGVVSWTPEGSVRPGPYTFRVRVTDDGVPARSDSRPVTVTVAVAALVPGSGELRVGGTNANDVISVAPVARDPSRLAVVVNGAPRGTYSVDATTRIVVYGLDGADRVTVSALVTKPADLYGGDGNDALTGGTGPDRLWGGDGNDRLTGGNGNDLLVGAAGRDVLAGGTGRDVLLGGDEVDNLNGGAGDDLLVSGLTNFDEDPAALGLVVAEWNSGDHTFQQRIDYLNGTTAGGANGSVVLTGGQTGTVRDDSRARDVLAGGPDRDWFLVSTPDVVSGLTLDDLRTTI